MFIYNYNFYSDDESQGINKSKYQTSDSISMSMWRDIASSMKKLDPVSKKTL